MSEYMEGGGGEVGGEQGRGWGFNGWFLVDV